MLVFPLFICFSKLRFVIVFWLVPVLNIQFIMNQLYEFDWRFELVRVCFGTFNALSLSLSFVAIESGYNF